MKRVDLDGGEGCCHFHLYERHQERVKKNDFHNSQSAYNNTNNNHMHTNLRPGLKVLFHS